MRPLCLIRAPCNLGLRPLRQGHEPGTWRAPQALTAAGLLEALRPATIVDLERPVYRAEAQTGTRLLNGQEMRRFNLDLAEEVARADDQSEFPVVIAGDCSILLGCLAGSRRTGPLSLVHIDGHSDFRHPGNYDPEAMLGAAAGMDLALATGRGERLMTEWPGVAAPLVPDEQVIQIGEREGFDADFAWPDVADTAFTRIDVFEARRMSPAAVLQITRETLNRQPEWRFWVHLDVDVLDASVMPAVDCPGSPGIDPQDLSHLAGALLGEKRCAGLTVTIFDPDLDPNGEHARFLADFLGGLFSE